MEALWIAALAVGALALGAAAMWVLREVWPWHSLMRRRVLLVMVTGEGDVTAEGILWARRGPLVILKSAAVHLTPNNPPTKVDGEMIIERDRIAWMQVVGSRVGTLQ